MEGRYRFPREGGGLPGGRLGAGKGGIIGALGYAATVSVFRITKYFSEWIGLLKTERL